MYEVCGRVSTNFSGLQPEPEFESKILLQRIEQIF